MPFFFLFVAVIVLASFVYYLEKEAAVSFATDDGENLDDDPRTVAAFRSIPHAIWSANPSPPLAPLASRRASPRLAASPRDVGRPSLHSLP